MGAPAVAKAWRDLVKREMPPDFVADLEKWLWSVAQEFNSDVALRFFRPPPEHRVVVTPGDVIRATGKYYVRNSGGSTFARESDGKGLYCAVTVNSVVPNYSNWNI